MITSKRFLISRSHRNFLKCLVALALVLGLHLDVAYSQHESGGGGVFRAGVVEVEIPTRRPDGDAVEAGRTVDSAENLPAINNATREGLKATAGTVQRGLKNRVNYFDYYLRIHDERIKVSPNHDSLRPTSTAASEDSAPEKTRKELLKERKKLKKKKAKLEKKRKKLQADLDRTTTELEELEKQPVPDTEIGKAIHKARLVNLRRKKGNLEKDLKKIDADIEKIDKRLKAIEEELKNPDLTSTYSERRPDPSPSLVRYFQFMGDLHVDYRVALGMAEGREQTIDLAEWMAASYLDTSAGHPFAMIMGPSILASGVSEVTVTVPSGEIAFGKDVAVEAAPVNMLPDNWEFFITGSFGRYDQDSLTGALDGFQSDTWTATLGLEYRIDPSLMVGIAYSYAETDTTVEGGQGDIDLTGSVISVYAVKSWNALSSGLLYSYGSYENDVSRSTGIGNSQGNADSDSNTISWMLDYALVRSENLVMGPSLDIDYGEGSVDGYRERGTGARNLSVAETNYQTMISSIGWEINYVKPTGYGLLACNLYAGWEHEYMPEDSPLTASLATTPAGLARGISPGITANGAHPGTDWLGLGVNVRLLTSGGWNCSVGYYGQVLRQSASSHIGTIGFSKSF